MKGIYRRSASYRVVLAVWLLCTASVNPSHGAQATPEQALAEQTAFQNAINGIADSVVRIEPSGLSVATLQGASEAIPNVGPSSGVVVGSDGWILTTEFAVPSDIEEVVITLPPKKKATDETSIAALFFSSVIPKSRSPNLNLFVKKTCIQVNGRLLLAEYGISTNQVLR